MGENFSTCYIWGKILVKLLQTVTVALVRISNCLGAGININSLQLVYQHSPNIPIY